MAGLLGNGPSRQFKVFRTVSPAIFRFNGKLYREFYDVASNKDIWIEIDEEEARPWLNAQVKTHIAKEGT